MDDRTTNADTEYLLTAIRRAAADNARAVLVEGLEAVVAGKLAALGLVTLQQFRGRTWARLA